MTTITLKVARLGDMLFMEVGGDYDFEGSRLELDATAKYNVMACITKEESILAARALAGQLYAKAADRMRRDIIRCIEAGLREALPMAAGASRSPEEVVSCTVGIDTTRETTVSPPALLRPAPGGVVTSTLRSDRDDG